MFRILLGVGGVIAAGLSVLWVVGVARVLDPSFNSQRQLSKMEMGGLAAVGLVGALTILVASGSALAYAKTGSASWLRPAAGGALFGLPLGLAWISLALVASSS